MAVPLALARDNAGKSIAAKMAMIAITTSSSIKVNPQVQLRDAVEVRFPTRGLNTWEPQVPSTFMTLW